jgi:hypothetical protein
MVIYNIYKGLKLGNRAMANPCALQDSVPWEEQEEPAVEQSTSRAGCPVDSRSPRSVFN